MIFWYSSRNLKGRGHDSYSIPKPENHGKPTTTAKNNNPHIF
jgi:hypothetical protein